jgi:hypothetical protein
MDPDQRGAKRARDQKAVDRTKKNQLKEQNARRWGYESTIYQDPSNNSLKKREKDPSANLQFPKVGGLTALGHMIAQVSINHSSVSVALSSEFICKSAKANQPISSPTH